MAPLSEWLCVLPGDLFSSSQKLVIYHYSRGPWEWFQQTAPAYRLGAQRKQHTAGQTRVMMTITSQGMWIKKIKKKVLCSVPVKIQETGLAGRRTFWSFGFRHFSMVKRSYSLLLFSHSAGRIWGTVSPRMSGAVKTNSGSLALLVKMRTTAFTLGSATNNHTRPAWRWKRKSVCWSTLNVVQFVWIENSHTN